MEHGVCWRFQSACGTWPGTPYTVITNTPLIREKPYLYVDSNTNYFVMVPNLGTNSLGTTWANGPTPGYQSPSASFIWRSRAWTMPPASTPH